MVYNDYKLGLLFVIPDSKSEPAEIIDNVVTSNKGKDLHKMSLARTVR